jgi:hypothetical protein
MLSLPPNSLALRFEQHGQLTKAAALRTRVASLHLALLASAGMGTCVDGPARAALPSFFADPCAADPLLCPRVLALILGLAQVCRHVDQCP